MLQDFIPQFKELRLVATKAGKPKFCFLSGTVHSRHHAVNRSSNNWLLRHSFPNIIPKSPSLIQPGKPALLCGLRFSMSRAYAHSGSMDRRFPVQAQFLMNSLKHVRRSHTLLMTCSGRWWRVSPNCEAAPKFV